MGCSCSCLVVVVEVGASLRLLRSRLLQVSTFLASANRFATHLPRTSLLIFHRSGHILTASCILSLPPTCSRNETYHRISFLDITSYACYVGGPLGHPLHSWSIGACSFSPHRMRFAGVSNIFNRTHLSYRPHQARQSRRCSSHLLRLHHHPPRPRFHFSATSVLGSMVRNLGNSTCTI
jgi:hypothetical protein